MRRIRRSLSRINLLITGIALVIVVMASGHDFLRENVLLNVAAEAATAASPES